MRILAGRAVDAHGAKQSVAVRVEQGKIVSIDPWGEVERTEPGDVDARDAIVMPGFIDIHIHGGAGRGIMEGTREAFDAVALHLARHGVTGFLATTITAPWEEQEQALAVTAAVMDSPENGSRGAAVLGCHLEGPYISPKRKGAQPEQFILPPSADDFIRHAFNYLGAVRVMTLAPEMPGGLELIRFLRSHGIVVSLGHTDATYAEVGKAIDAGASHVTHCYNAMTQLGSREPGVVGAALSRPELKAELIWDNVHVHPASCQALIRAKGTDGVILISDGIPGAGMQDGYVFSLGDLPVSVKGGTARLPDGTLAGSLLTLDAACRNAAMYSLSQRSEMASFNAARSLGLATRKGLLAKDFDADFVILNADGRVRQTYVEGRAVYTSE